MSVPPECPVVPIQPAAPKKPRVKQPSKENVDPKKETGLMNPEGGRNLPSR